MLNLKNFKLIVNFLQLLIKGHRTIYLTIKNKVVLRILLSSSIINNLREVILYLNKLYFHYKNLLNK